MATAQFSDALVLNAPRYPSATNLIDLGVDAVAVHDPSEIVSGMQVSKLNWTGAVAVEYIRDPNHCRAQNLQVLTPKKLQTVQEVRGRVFQRRGEYEEKQRRKGVQ